MMKKVFFIVFALFILSIIVADNAYSVSYWSYVERGYGEPTFHNSTSNATINYPITSVWTCTNSNGVYSNTKANGTLSFFTGTANDQYCNFDIPDISQKIAGEFDFYSDGSGDEYFGFGQGTNEPTLSVHNGVTFFIAEGYGNTETCDTSVYNEWVHFQFVYNPSTMFAIRFKTATSGYTSWCNETNSVPASLTQMFFWENNGNGYYLDRFVAWNGTISDNPLENLGDSTPPVITLLYPSNNSYINTNLYIYGNVSDNENITNVYTNDSRFNVYSGSTYNKSFYFNFSCSGGCSDGKYSVNITVNDTANLKDFVVANFTIDVTNPVLTILEPLNSRKYTNDTVNFSIICEDDNLFGLDVLILNSSTEWIYNYSLRNITKTYYQFNHSFNLSNYPDGTYTYTASCLDGHTSNIVNDYEVIKTDNALTIGDFTITSKTTPLYLDYTKKTDRYTFDYTFMLENDYIFDVTSDKLIYFINDKYNSHLVSGGNWFDTNPYKPKSLVRINDNHYQITLTGDMFNFNSVGDLNNITQTNTFYISRFLFIDNTWEGLKPDNNTLFYNQSVISMEFNYTNSNGNQSYCTLYRNNTNISTALFNTGINNISDTIATPINTTYDYIVSCYAFAEGFTYNTTNKILSFDNSLFVESYTETSLSDRVFEINKLFFIVFMFCIHFALMYFGFRYANIFMLSISLLLGILASFTALTYLGIVYIFGASMFFIVYIILCITGMFYVYPKDS